MDDYGLRKVLRKSGKELFHENGKPVGMDLLDFWQWSSSDLISNILRGRLAEFLVASALDVAHETRIEWDAIDVISKTGVRVEVKSSAYLQSWKARPSRITFDIKPRLAWDWEANRFISDKPERLSDVYVFCLLNHVNPDVIDPTNLNQWRFFIIATKAINVKLGDQKTLSLATLRSLNSQEADYSELAATIEFAAKESSYINSQ